MCTYTMRQLVQLLDELGHCRYGRGREIHFAACNVLASNLAGTDGKCATHFIAPVKWLAALFAHNRYYYNEILYMRVRVGY